MSFLQLRHEQLAHYLREQIRQGRLVEPLPSTRAWAGQLGVSCTTLYAALRTLQREKLVISEPRRGTRLAAARRPVVAPHAAKMVRLVYRGADYPDCFAYASWYGLLSQRLQTHGLQLGIERCTDARLRALSRPRTRSDPTAHELLFLRSLSEKYQRRFSRSGRPVLIVGYRAPGVALPFVTCDLEGAIRHAAHGLLRRGFTHLHFLVNRVKIHAVQRQCDAFDTACAAWPHQPIRAEILRVSLEPTVQVTTLYRFAARLRGRQGILVMQPVSAAAVMTAILGHHVGIPEQAEVVVVDSLPGATILWPPPMHYQISPEALVKTLARAAVHFFETGLVPKIARMVPLEMIKAEPAPRGSGVPG